MSNGSSFSSLRVQIFDQGSYVGVTQPQVGHLHLFVFGIKGGGDGIAIRNHLVRCRDESRKPVVIAGTGDSKEVRAYTVAMTHGMAGGATRTEEV